MTPSENKNWPSKRLAIGATVVAMSLVLALTAFAFSRPWETMDRKLAKPSDNLLKSFNSAKSSHGDELPDSEVIFVKSLTPEEPFYSGTVDRTFYWEAWQEQWVLRVWRDTRFLAPSFLVRREGVNDSWVEPPTSHSHCFVRGVVDNVEGSDAALSLCGGLRGIIRIGGLVYFIEPSGESTSAFVDNLATRSPEDREGDGQGVDNLGPHVLTFVPPSYLRDPEPVPTASPSKVTPSDTGASRLSVSQLTGSGYISRSNNQDLSGSLSSARLKRFIVSKRHTIEVMVVVDQNMALYHGKRVDQYVLTLMSVVSLIFRDSSIGSNIDIAVVEVVQPEGTSFSPSNPHENYGTASGKSAEEMLKVFCKWQKLSLKYDADHPHRYDTALLITRENICRNPFTQRCDTLGLAELGTMCSRYASCAIVQDNGLSAAFTIAHELGHLLNMPHDNDDKCSPFRGSKVGNDKHMNVMSRMLDHNTLPWIWSNCSRYYLSEFFQAGLGDCLEDSPWSNQIAEDDVELTLAGELFSATQQCQYVFGRTSSICPYMPKCKRLWCTTTMDEKEGCRTQHMPWADGTPCDRNRWCLRGECTLKNKAELKKVHGEWGAWLPWSSCSRSCGVGVRRSERFCDSPKPQFGGQFCLGERVRYESCKVQECQRGSLDFRSLQCQQFNGRNFGLPDIPQDVKWIQKYNHRTEDSCKLFCQAHNNGVSYLLKEKVEDGTPCGPDSYDICVEGKCRVAGCDYVLNSTLRDDICGVCNGDNSTCEVVTGTLEDAQPWGYSNVILVPEGAARLEVSQRSYLDTPADDNYLALIDYETGEYLLNGNWVVTPFEKMVEFTGCILEYTGSNTVLEKINSTKPLQKMLLIQILSVGKLYPPYIHYSYTRSVEERTPNYSWKLSPWSECSRPCIGDREQTPYCVRDDTNARVSDNLCSKTDAPARRRKSCALECSVHWTYSDWSECSLDEEENCVKRRVVDGCVTVAETAVEVERCAGEKQATEMACQKDECPAWKQSEWSSCHCPSGTNTGQKNRLFGCYLRDHPVSEWLCQNQKKPTDSKNCPCWYAGDWSEECEEEEKETTLEVRSAEEANEKLPETDDFDRRSYIQKATVYEEPTWISSQQQPCPRGKRRRIVICGPPHSPSPDHECDLEKKPSLSTSCEISCTTVFQPTTTTTLSPAVPTPSEAPVVVAEEALKRENFNKLLNKIKLKLGRGFGRGSLYVKGGKNNGERTAKNEISNSISPPTAQPGVVYSNKIYDKEELDSGEEESSDLLKGRQKLGNHLWQVGRWSKCSTECGGGERNRRVYCGSYNYRHCPTYFKPRNRELCNEHPCAEWAHGEWSQCRPTKHDPCKGTKRRIVICRDSDGRKASPHFCLSGDRPESEVPCKNPCERSKRLPHRYRWKKHDWSSCSEECDGGFKTRNVTCIDHFVGSSSTLSDFCLQNGRPKPRSKRRCNTHPCSLHWVTSEWSQCSWKCGLGIQKMEVSCHGVSPLGWVDPDPLLSGCNNTKIPVLERSCNLGQCASGFFWVEKPWKPCQAPCGSKGSQRRSVICVDFKGVRAQKAKCSKAHRPKRKQRCKAPPCGYTSCFEVQAALGVTVDGEYSLLIGGVNMSIFCHGMNTTDPKEYLTLPAGEEGNYAEIYDKRLLRPDTCPFNGERNDLCSCVTDESGRSGMTVFSRILVNVTSLTVNTFDFTFSRAIIGRFIAFGEAGDCYSATPCPQGSFSINLVGTLLKVSERTQWKGHGNKASLSISRLDGGQRVLGRCGGYCGTCTPDPELGLKLEVRVTEDMLSQ